MATSKNRSKSRPDVQFFHLADVAEEKRDSRMSRRLVMGRNLMLASFTVKKGVVVPPHKHESEQLTFVLEGAIKFTINRRDFVVRKGDLLVIPPNVRHKATVMEDSVDLDFFSPVTKDWFSSNRRTQT